MEGHPPAETILHLLEQMEALTQMVETLPVELMEGLQLVEKTPMGTTEVTLPHLVTMEELQLTVEDLLHHLVPKMAVDQVRVKHVTYAQLIMNILLQAQKTPPGLRQVLEMAQTQRLEVMATLLPLIQALDTWHQREKAEVEQAGGSPEPDVQETVWWDVPDSAQGLQVERFLQLASDFVLPSAISLETMGEKFSIAFKLPLAAGEQNRTTSYPELFFPYHYF